jgi:hypothetical protein
MIVWATKTVTIWVSPHLRCPLPLAEDGRL